MGVQVYWYTYTLGCQSNFFFVRKSGGGGGGGCRQIMFFVNTDSNKHRKVTDDPRYLALHMGSFSQAEFRHGLPARSSTSVRRATKAAKRAWKALSTRPQAARDVHVEHCPVVEARSDCAVCWKMHHTKIKSMFACSKCKNRKGNPAHLCIKQDKNYFQVYHSPAFEYR